MRFNEVMEEISKHKWWLESGPATIQTLVLPLHSFITQANIFHPKLLTITIFGFKDAKFFEYSPEEEKYKVYKYVFEKMKQDKDFLNKCIENKRKVVEDYFKETDKFMANKDSMTNKQVAKSYSKVMTEYVNFLEYGAGIECIDIPTTYYLKNWVMKEINGVDKLEEEEKRELLIALTSPKILSFMEMERVDFLKICIDHFDDIKNNNLTDELKIKLEKHSKEFFYVLNNFKTVKDLDINHFWNACIKELKTRSKEKIENEFNNLKNKVSNLQKKKKEIFDKYDFSDDLKLHLKITETMGASIDERKATMLKTNYYVIQYCTEVAKRFDLDEKDVMNYTYDEIIDLLVEDKAVDLELFKKRIDGFAYVMTRDINTDSDFNLENDFDIESNHDTKSRDKKNKLSVHVDWFYDEEASKIMRGMDSDTTDSEKEGIIQGNVANAPVNSISGNVQVIHDVYSEDFKEGNILVATMTRPEFVPLMRKAKAIITDEGGLTCHAAVVSRELGVPCIIGTKIATKVLKDGDEVQINLKIGIIKKVK